MELGTKERKDRQKEILRQKILDVANQLFQEVGYDGTTMRKIAARIVYNPATIYSYFKNKEDIFYALQKKAFQAFYEYLNPMRAIEDPAKRMTSLGRAYIKFALENPVYYDLMFIMREPMQAVDEHEGWKIGERNFQLLHQTVEECLATGKIPNGDAEAIAMMIWGAVHGLVSLYIRDRCKMFEGHDIDFLLRQAHATFSQMLFSQGIK